MLAKKNDISFEIKSFNHSEDELRSTAKLLNQVWPDAGHLNFEYLRWQYIENPIGLAYGFNAWFENEIVGHYAAIPVSAVIFGKPELGLLSVNTAVRDDFRGRNLFKTLATNSFEKAKASGLKFVIGVANQNSTLLFKRQLKFQIVSQLDVKLGIGQVVLPKGIAEETDFQFNMLNECLNWRMARPSTSYFSREKFIFTDTHNLGIKAQVTSRLNEGVQIKCSKKISFSNRINPLNLYIGLGNVITKGFFIKLPEKLKPSPLNLIFKDLTDQSRIIRPEKSIIELIDFDAY